MLVIIIINNKKQIRITLDIRKDEIQGFEQEYTLKGLVPPTRLEVSENI